MLKAYYVGMETAKALVDGLKENHTKTVKSAIDDVQKKLVESKSECQQIITQKIADGKEKTIELLKPTIRKIVGNYANELKMGIVEEVKNEIKKGRFTFTEECDLESTRNDPNVEDTALQSTSMDTFNVAYSFSLYEEFL